MKKAIKDHQKKLFWEATNAAYAALREDQEAWDILTPKNYRLLNKEFRS